MLDVFVQCQQCMSSLLLQLKAMCGAVHGHTAQAVVLAAQEPAHAHDGLISPLGLCAADHGHLLSCRSVKKFRATQRRVVVSATQNPAHAHDDSGVFLVKAGCIQDLGGRSGQLQWCA